ncbi:MAG: hypothetical protein V3U57_06585 [Robiginitomaculum sp.]
MSGFERFHSDSMKNNITVFKKDDGAAISGTIRLNGQGTEVDLLCESFIEKTTTIEGWFDILLYKDHRVEGDDPILLHNAMQIGGGTYHQDIKRWRTILYPNLIIYSADALADNFLIRKISFSIEHLEKFFYYREVESHYVDTLDEAKKKSLLSLLREHTKQWLANTETCQDLEPQYDFNTPQRLHIVHDRGETLQFTIDEDAYKATGGTAMGATGGKVYNYLTINFAKLQTIDKALKAVDCWIWFFNQLSFEQLDLLDVSASGSNDRSKGMAEFYMPNLVRAKPKQSSPHLHPIYLPFSLWKEKDKLRQLMSTWMAKSTERDSFRARVNDTLLGRSSADYISQIGSLVAGIDTLPELNTNDGIDKATRTSMAKAARGVDSAGGIDISTERLTGLFGMLNKASLKDKISRITEVAHPNLSTERRKSFVENVLRLRTSAAHGSSLVDEVQPYAFPISQALQAICVIYDLKTCAEGIEGFDSGQLMARQTLDFAMSNLETLSSHKN